MVVVTKTFPASDVGHLFDLGVRDFGENRDQDAVEKVRACSDMGLAELRWHFIGQLQTNKARSVAAYAHLVHSIDRLRLVSTLEAAAAARARTLGCLVQVDLDERPDGAAANRGGVSPARIAAVAAAVEAARHLALEGLMAVAPRVGDAATAFRQLASVADELRSTYPHAAVLSAGMSGDLEAAVRYGATHLRVGTAILGSRPHLG